SERRDMLSGLMFVLTLLAYLRYIPASGRPRALWYAAALGAYVLCLLSKAMAMTLPAVLLILDVYPLRRLSGWRVWVEKLPFALLALAAAVVALIGQRKGALLQRITEFGVVQRIATACYAVCFYMWKTLAPFDLMPMYERP